MMTSSTLGIFGCANPLAAQDNPPSTATAPAETPQVLSQMTAAAKAIAAEHDVPAIVMGIVQDGDIAGFVTEGVLDRSTAEPVADNTVFQIASLSKIFTGTLARELVLNGGMDPAAPVTAYLPAELTREAGAKLDGVTVAHLIHHRSGLPRDTAVVAREGNDPMLVPLSEEGLLEDLRVAEMVGPPGAQYEYSNLGYGLLGYILERASGESYAALLDRLILSRYALHDTGSAVPEGAEERLATPYRKEDGAIPTQSWRTGKLVSASGLYSTARDLAKLMQAQIKIYRSSDPSQQNLLLTAVSEPVTAGRSYGYGMNVQTMSVDGENVDLYYHSGDMDGYAGFYGFVPSRNIGIVLLTSRGGEGKERLQRIAARHMLGLPTELHTTSH